MSRSTAARCRPSLGHRTKLALAALCAAAVTFAAGPAAAADDPTLTWWTLETDHFYITYPEPVEPAARRIADLAESIHVRVAEGMQFEPDEKTEILLTDDTDSANGSATPVPYNTIRLFLTAPGDLSTLGDYDDWYLGLLTHEYTHILHTGNISGLASVANRVIGRTLAPNSAQPRWIIEGLAVVFESEYSTGGRIRSSLFDMYLRADVLEDNFARLDQISSGAERWPYGNLFYLYGSRFLRWISDIYGPDTMPAVSADYGATTVPWGINRAIRRVTGRTYEDLYDAWLLHLKRHYAAQVAAVDARGRREGVRITFGAHGAAYPRFVPKAARKDPTREEIMYFRDDYRTTSGFYRFALGDVTKSGEREEDFEIRTPNEGAPAFSEAGDVLFGSVAYYKNIYGRTDLHSVPKGETSKNGIDAARRRLTHGLRATQPDVSPDGKLVAFAVNSMGTTTLTIADRDVDGALSNIRPLIVGDVFDQAYSPRFSPDGKQVAYSAWSRGGYRDIRIVDVKTGKSRDVTRDRSLDLQPEWSPDGRSIYFSSDRTGIFNIYRIDLQTGDTKLVTNVHNGAVAPTVSADGKRLVYLGYSHEGYDLYAMPIAEDRLLSAPPPPEDRGETYSEPPRARAEKSRYNPLRTLRPYTYGIDVGAGNYSTTAVTLSAAGSDLVGHHSIGASVRFDPGAPEPRFDLSYDYGGLPVNLGASFTRQVVPRLSGFNVSGVDVPFDETQNSFSTSVSAGFADPYVSQSARLSYSATAYQSALQTPAKLDPF
ncbi:MAG: PD40 domain-containing protein, partial [Myxococcales bacterium]|nr:PD40 domain-containing protein [Myxococcales bacterium]